MSKTKDFLNDFSKTLASKLESTKGKWDCIFKRGSMPINASTNNRYSGINWLMLNYETEKKEYSKPIFSSYKQWASLKGQVKKGSKGTKIIFYKPLTQPSKIDPTKLVQAGCILNSSTVFNIDQVDLSESKYRPDEFKTGKQYSIKLIDDFVKATKVEIKNSEGHGCYYNQTKDFINMELKTNFKDTKESNATLHYYSTLFHELTHSTGHKNRLDRKDKFDDRKKSYAYEELVAEIGSIFFGYEFNITKTIRDNHAKYLNSWIKELKNDYTFLTGATAQAQKAVDYFVSTK
jgi:antirestriction protein ArdC